MCNKCLCRVMEAAVWAVGCWAGTYLLSEEEDLSPAMSEAFGPAGNGPSVLAALVQVAGSLLSGQAGEVELHRVVCTRLLAVLVHRRHVTHRMVQLHQWHSLAGESAACRHVECMLRCTCKTYPVHFFRCQILCDSLPGFHVVRSRSTQKNAVM